VEGWSRELDEKDRLGWKLKYQRGRGTPTDIDRTKALDGMCNWIVKMRVCKSCDRADEKGMNGSHDCEVHLEVTVRAGY
jgi:hypothetical protein